MPSIIVNEFPTPLPDGSGQISLVGQISRVQNLGVTYDVAPESPPSFTLAARSGRFPARQR